MDWKNFKIEKPKHKDEVLVCLNRSDYFTSVYNHIENTFPYFDRNGPRDLIMNHVKDEVHWTLLTKPEN